MRRCALCESQTLLSYEEQLSLLSDDEVRAPARHCGALSDAWQEEELAGAPQEAMLDHLRRVYCPGVAAGDPVAIERAAWHALQAVPIPQ